MSHMRGLMGAKMNILRKLRVRRSETAESTEAATMGRREFFGNALAGSAVLTATWLATDLAYDSYDGAYEAKWLQDYYQSDFYGV